MGGCRCSYKNCTNTTKTRENLHFFHYPVKQKDRCRQWIENAHKPQFYDLDEDQLRNKVVCETHFLDSYFPNMQKKRLLQGAIPTLDGDCEIEEPASNRIMKIQDVQVLPASADGTLFVLETQNNYQNEKVESYIYTNNGLVLPLNKCAELGAQSLQFVNDADDSDDEGRMRIDYEANEAKNENTSKFSYRSDSPRIDHYETISGEFKQPNHLRRIRATIPAATTTSTTTTTPKTVEDPSKAISNKYAKTIKQHSKDIAIIKRILKKRARCRKINNPVILSHLKKQLPPSLYSIVSMHLKANVELTDDDGEFLSVFYTASPELYSKLIDTYQWRLPVVETVSPPANKKNGHLN